LWLRTGRATLNLDEVEGRQADPSKTIRLRRRQEGKEGQDEGQ
jgi:hypothetical protein